MIPKIIHYCWYGNKEKPVKFLKYMDTWKKIGGGTKPSNGMKQIVIYNAITT
jgi:hypothetical protein